MTDLAAAAGEVFQILRSFDYTVMLYDEEGNRVEDPTEALRMFARPANLLVSMTDDGDNSAVKLFLGKTTPITAVLGLVQTLRTAASKFNLLFNVRQYGKEISAKEIASGRMTETLQRDTYTMQISEGMYGTSKSSYLKLEGVDGKRGARMIVRHSAKIDESKPGARSRFLENIFIENPRGERLLFPTLNLAPARAMTQHLNHGGSFTDAVGSHIQREATEYNNLGIASRYIAANADALGENGRVIREACRAKMREMRSNFATMFRPSGYLSECDRINEKAKSLMEGGEQEPVMTEEIMAEGRAMLAVEGKEIADCVVEAAYRALHEAGMKKIKEAQPVQNMPNTPAGNVQGEVEEGAKEVILPTVSVVGYKVEKGAWEDLKRGKLELIRKPPADENPIYLNKRAELDHKFQLLIPFVRNNSMLNLLSYIAGNMEHEENPKRRSDMIRIAMAALSAAGMGLNEGLSPNNPVLREFSDWLGDFRAGRVLSEAGIPPRHLMGHNPYDDEGEFEATVDRAMDAFDPESFADEFIADNFDVTDENETRMVSRDQLLASIEHELIMLVQRFHDTLSPHTLSQEAAVLMPQVEGALAKLGFKVVEPELIEGIELSREDVLLPKKNQGLDLRREVVKTKVHDPETGEEENPDSAYLARMRTLAGI